MMTKQINVLLAGVCFIFLLAVSVTSAYASGSDKSSIGSLCAKNNLIPEDPFKSIDVGSAVFSVTFSPDSKRIVSGSRDGVIRLWDVKSKTKLSTWDKVIKWWTRGYGAADVAKKKIYITH